jgi:hypothetical protein
MITVSDAFRQLNLFSRATGRGELRDRNAHRISTALQPTRFGPSRLNVAVRGGETGHDSFAGTLLALAVAAVFLLLFLLDEYTRSSGRNAHVDVTLGGGLEQCPQFGELRLHQSEGNHRCPV